MIFVCKLYGQTWIYQNHPRPACATYAKSFFPLQWCHNECDGVPNHPFVSKKTSKLCGTVLCEFHAQMFSNAEMCPFDRVTMLAEAICNSCILLAAIWESPDLSQRDGTGYHDFALNICKFLALKRKYRLIDNIFVSGNAGVVTNWQLSEQPATTFRQNYDISDIHLSATLIKLSSGTRFTNMV